MPVKRLGMALFLSPHLLLSCTRPSLRPAGTQGLGYHWAFAVQTATRAAIQAGVVLIRKTRPFEEPHAIASHN
jgi:hypothetical protein